MELIRDYSGNSGPMTADGILRFALNPKAYMRMKNRERKSKAIAFGLCTTCGDKADEGFSKCAFHREQDAQRLRDKRRSCKP